MTTPLKQPSQQDLDTFVGLRSDFDAKAVTVEQWETFPCEHVEVGIRYAGMTETMWYPGCVTIDPGYRDMPRYSANRFRIQHPVSGATLRVAAQADDPATDDTTFPVAEWVGYPDDTEMLRTLWRAFAPQRTEAV